VLRGAPDLDSSLAAAVQVEEEVMRWEKDQDLHHHQHAPLTLVSVKYVVVTNVALLLEGGGVTSRLHSLLIIILI